MDEYRLTEVPWKGDRHYELELWIAPERRGRGAGAALWAAADRELTELGAAVVEVEVRDEVAVGFAERRGFVVTQRFAGMELDLTTADEAALATAVRRADGATIHTLAEAAAAQGREPADRALYELNRRLSPDIPGNGDTFPPYETFRAEVLGADWFRPDLQYVAAAGEHWVGLAGVGVRDERTAAHEFTAVDRGFRRRGIATALKARAALDAKALGLARMVTGNDETNAGILAVNAALGFRRVPGVVRLHQHRT